MPAKQLPDRPSLEQYKKQAKEPLKAWNAGDSTAVARVREHHPRLSKSSEVDFQRSTFTLADAQFVIAREHGFESWPTFANQIKAVTEEPPADRIWRAAEDALVKGDDVLLERVLRDHGEMLRKGPVQSTWWGGLAPDYSEGEARSIIAREHFFSSWDKFVAFREALKDGGSPVARFETAVDAVITGDIPTLERLLRTTPELIRARSSRTHRATLLHYVGANGVEGFRQRTPKNAVKVPRSRSMP